MSTERSETHDMDSGGSTMNSITRLGESDAALWRAFVDRCPLATEDHLLDATKGESQGFESRAVGRREGDRIVCGAHIRIRREKLIPGCIVRMQGGGLYESLNSPEQLDELLDAVAAEVRNDGPIFIEWSVRAPRIVDETEVPENRFIGEWLVRRGLEQAPLTEATYWVDISSSEDEIMARMHKNFRRDFRKAEREGVVVRPCTPDEVDQFYEMSAEMDRIKGLKETSYRLASREAFTRYVRKVMAVNAGTLFCAEWQGAIRNMALVTTAGTPRYLYGATGAEARGDVKTPPTGQLLHWEIMRTLKACGHTTYDLGGTFARVLQPDHPNYGVWQFKSRMGGKYIEFFPRHRLVCRPLLMSLYKRVKG